MATRAKRPRDFNQLAKLIVDIAVGDKVDKASADGKDPAAVVSGRLGGLKGGKTSTAELGAGKLGAKRKMGGKMKKTNK